jgi:hypothetical protein
MKKPASNHISSNLKKNKDTMKCHLKNKSQAIFMKKKTSIPSMKESKESALKLRNMKRKDKNKPQIDTKNRSINSVIPI